MMRRRITVTLAAVAVSAALVAGGILAVRYVDNQLFCWRTAMLVGRLVQRGENLGGSQFGVPLLYGQALAESFNAYLDRCG
jgi:hypothetical protein